MPNDVKRFILLGGATYYACGGFHDFISSHDSMEDAVNKGNRLLSSDEFVRDTHSTNHYGWFHVWDCRLREVVTASEGQAYGTADETPAMEEQVNAQRC